MGLYNILLALTKMMAQYSFTAEEMEFYTKKQEESIFLTSFQVQPEFMDKELEKMGKPLMYLHEVNKALEIKRQQKFIGNSLRQK